MRTTRNMAGRATTVDDDAATELDLYAENTGELYPMRQAIEKNLLGKRAKRMYDSAKAIKGFQPLADRAAVMYAREYGGDKSMFNAATRREVARRFRDRFEAEARIAERNRGLETWVKNDPVVARAERGGRNRSGGTVERYKIVRSYLHHPPRVIKRGLTMAEAHAHTRNPETSSKTATSARARAHTLKYGPWFDGFDVDTKPRRRRNRSGGCLPCGTN